MRPCKSPGAQSPYHDNAVLVTDQRLRDNCTDATRKKQFRNRDEQVYQQKDHIAHVSKAVMFVVLCKTGRRGPLGPELRDWP